MSLNKLDQAQIIKSVYDDVSEALKVKVQDSCGQRIIKRSVKV